MQVTGLHHLVFVKLRVALLVQAPFLVRLHILPVGRKCQDPVLRSSINEFYFLLATSSFDFLILDSSPLGYLNRPEEELGRFLFHLIPCRSLR